MDPFPNKPGEDHIGQLDEYFDLLSATRQAYAKVQSPSITDELLSFIDLLLAFLQQKELASVQQGLEKLRILLDFCRPRLNAKPSQSFEQDHAELMLLATQYEGPLSSYAIARDLGYLDKTRR